MKSLDSKDSQRFPYHCLLTYLRKFCVNFGYLLKGNELRIDRCKTVLEMHAQLCPLAALHFLLKVRIIFRRYNFSLKDGDEDAEDEEFEDEDAEDDNAQDEEDEEQEEYSEDEDIPEDEVAEADEESDPLTGKSGFAHPIAN